jgi:hypothetical protein
MKLPPIDSIDDYQVRAQEEKAINQRLHLFFSTLEKLPVDVARLALYPEENIKLHKMMVDIITTSHLDIYIPGALEFIGLNGHKLSPVFLSLFADLYYFRYAQTPIQNPLGADKSWTRACLLSHLLLSSLKPELLTLEDSPKYLEEKLQSIRARIETSVRGLLA